MDMNRAFYSKVEKHTPQWRVVDAEGEIVGRLATKIADMLRGKDKPTYTPHSDTGAYVVVINAEKVVFTGSKMENKTYDHYTGYIGGLKTRRAKDLIKKDPAEILRHAVEGMMPKTKLARAMHRKLKIYAGPEHPHKAQLV